MLAPSNSTNCGDEISRLFDASKNGDREALGVLLDGCANHLYRIAHQKIAADLRAKLDESDLVQQTFLDAQCSFSQFRGTTLGELQAWLRRILLNNLASENRRYRATGKRSVMKEQAVVPERMVHYENRGMASGVHEIEGEYGKTDEAVLLTWAMAQLSNSHITVILWRTFAQLSFEEVGFMMDRSADASRMLWSRAINELRVALVAIRSEDLVSQRNFRPDVVRLREECLQLADSVDRL